MTQRTHVSANPALIARLHAACAPEGMVEGALDLAISKSAFAFGWRDMPLISDAGLAATTPAAVNDKRPEEA